MVSDFYGYAVALQLGFHHCKRCGQVNSPKVTGWPV
jgi:hypothetical protein